MSSVGIVVGNPKVRSRTRTVAEAVAAAAAGAAGLAEAEQIVVDLAELGPQLFDWSSLSVRDAVDRIRGTSLTVVASPTYKASYTGLLKAFLDWFSATDLLGVTVVPVMVGAGPQHALAVEVHLRPCWSSWGRHCRAAGSTSPRISSTTSTTSSRTGCATPGLPCAPPRPGEPRDEPEDA